MRCKLLVISLLIGVVASPSLAKPIRYDIDSAHTDISWMADHLGFSKSIGEFGTSSGHITLDEEQPSESSVEITVDIASLHTGDSTFDKHLLAKEFFNYDEFKRATFKSTNVTLTGEKTATVTGDLSLHGVTKPLTLGVTLNKIGKNAFSGKQTAGFTVRGLIYRSQYGMTYGLPLVGDQVDLVIEAEAVLSTAAKPAP
ncbi:MAG: YceI family protein [Rickettsiales bacterium]|nr:YceI family protein [Rickettsiales bacterium]